ncbi:hypothetical protein [Endozoicomonas elysicola]|uniref:Uncharacterized protein n=1 Tax=Endozoicomonas elysicola TaxID=305900 RepID=A0A081K6W9_9GAMM|nr:hypothetical protein [Endozoicomonas elysicola]KEI69895.1 hypothetical protein GV64_03290 [Endozoicomonas elysicola]
MARPLNPNQYQSAQNFTAQAAARQPRPEHPPGYQRVMADKLLPTSSQLFEPSTPPQKTTKTRTITTVTLKPSDKTGSSHHTVSEHSNSRAANQQVLQQTLRHSSDKVAHSSPVDDIFNKLSASLALVYDCSNADHQRPPVSPAPVTTGNTKITRESKQTASTSMSHEPQVKGVQTQADLDQREWLKQTKEILDTRGHTKQELVASRKQRLAYIKTEIDNARKQPLEISKQRAELLKGMLKNIQEEVIQEQSQGSSRSFAYTHSPVTQQAATDIPLERTSTSSRYSSFTSKTSSRPLTGVENKRGTLFGDSKRSSFHQLKSSSSTTSGSDNALPARSKPTLTTSLPDEMGQMMSKWKSESEARSKEFFSDFDSRSWQLKKELAPLSGSPPTATLAQLSFDSTHNDKRSLSETRSSSQGITLQSSYKAPHIPEAIDLILVKLMERYIEYATLDVSVGLQYLRTALADAHNKLSWDTKSKWSATQALRSSQRSLDTLVREYQIANLNSLTDRDIPKFKGQVQQCVQKFMEAVKEITPDRENIVTLKIDVSTSSGVLEKKPTGLT